MLSCLSFGHSGDTVFVKLKKSPREPPVKQTKYVDIADDIQHKIETEVYSSNQRLPSQRELAELYATTPVTVSKAIKLLVERHLLSATTGRGTFVLAKGELKTGIQANSDAQRYNFSILQPCLGYNEKVIANQFTKLVRSQSFTKFLDYHEDTGLEIHKQAAMDWCVTWGLKPTSNHDFLLVNGAQQALSVLVEVFTQPGDVVLVEQFAYPGLLAILKTLHRKPVPVNMDSEGICDQHLEEQIALTRPKLLVLNPTVQNPTTTSLSEKRRILIANVIQNNQLLTVEDDLYAFLGDSKLPRLADLAPDFTFYVSSLSKAISPGLRAGFLRAPCLYTKRLSDFLRVNHWLSPPVTFEIARELINSGEAKRLAQGQKNLACERQKRFSDIFDRALFETKPTSFHVWLRLPEHWQANEFIAKANQQGIQLVGESSFTHLSNERFVRVSLMSIESQAEFVKGLQKLKLLYERDEGTAQ